MDSRHPSFREAFRYWLKLGFISFGGPAGQIAIMHREVVEKRRWFSDGHFLHALNFCTLLPGPEAQQLATYLGWRLHGARGGIAAGALFVLPSAVILYGLSWAFVMSAQLPWLASAFLGMQAAVIAIVAAAVIRIGRKALKTPAQWALAAASFALLSGAGISFIIILAAAALMGAVVPRWFPSGSHGGAGTGAETSPLELPPSPRASWPRTFSVLALCGVLWWLPIIGAGVALGWDSTPALQGLFFSKAALVTFGGAYAVLPYVAQQAVEQHQWLSHAQMMTGLGLAESTPGPLIIVLQFVGFVGGWQNPGSLSPAAAATVCALMTTWTTFLPSFLMVFLGAPHVEQLRAAPRLGASLAAITAAVVGVILSLAVWFFWHTAFPSGQWRSPDFFVALVAAASFVALQRFKLGVATVIGAAALLGLLGAAVRG